MLVVLEGGRGKVDVGSRGRRNRCRGDKDHGRLTGGKVKSISAAGAVAEPFLGLVVRSFTAVRARSSLHCLDWESDVRTGPGSGLAEPGAGAGRGGAEGRAGVREESVVRPPG